MSKSNVTGSEAGTTDALSQKTLKELTEMAKAMGLSGLAGVKKQALIERIEASQPKPAPEPEPQKAENASFAIRMVSLDEVQAVEKPKRGRKPAASKPASIQPGLFSEDVFQASEPAPSPANDTVDAIVLPEKTQLQLGGTRKRAPKEPKPVIEQTPAPAVEEMPAPAVEEMPAPEPVKPFRFAKTEPKPRPVEPVQEHPQPDISASPEQVSSSESADSQESGQKHKRRSPRLQKLDPSKLVLEELPDDRARAGAVLPVIVAEPPVDPRQNRFDNRRPDNRRPQEPRNPQQEQRNPQQDPRNQQRQQSFNENRNQPRPVQEGRPPFDPRQPQPQVPQGPRPEPWSQFNIPESTETNLQKRIEELSPKLGGMFFAEGVLEIQPERFGLVRSLNYYYQPSADDFYVAPALINRFKLRQGDTVVGICRAPKVGERYFGMVKIEGVNGVVPGPNDFRKNFEELLPIYPDTRIRLEHSRSENVTRLIDLFAPIGRGQRSMIVAQPKTGKTTILRRIANAVAVNHPEMKTLILLVDERPEEVTEMERTAPKAEVVASTFDMKPEMHVALAELVFEKAKRLVEAGHHVLILLDSLTRLARAYNVCAGNGGRTMTGGIDSQALKKPRQLFSSARNIEGGGSLTIIASALVDTGSRMDDVIFEEFKGTGNNEIVLDRRLANNRIFPALDIFKSGTRREDLFVKEEEREKVALLRRFVAAMSPVEAMEFLQDKIKNSRDNMDFLLSMNREGR